MSRFWITYLLSAVIGTALAYFGAPALSAQLALRTRPLGLGTQRPDARQQAATLETSTPASVSAISLRPLPDEPAVYDNGSPPMDDGPNGVASVKQTPDAQLPAAPLAGALYRAPGANPQASSWGILKQNAPHYATSGQNLGKLPAGTVGEISKTTTSSNGDVAVCTLDIDGQWKGPVLVGRENLIVFEGPLTRVPPETLDLLHRYFTLKGRIDARTADLQQKVLSANPYAAAYARADQEFIAFIARVKTLIAQRDAATGPRRSDLINQLHAMQSDQTRLRLARENAAAKMKEWNEKGAPRLPDTARDPELSGWIAELRRIEPEKQKIIP